MVGAPVRVASGRPGPAMVRRFARGVRSWLREKLEGPMWRREQRSLAAELVADCRAFLLGQYADRLESLAIAVPVWAWTNLLAHASESELRVEALSSGAPGRGNDGWHAARAYLAAEVLEVAAQSGTLDALQEESLVPLEMDLAARADVRRWDSRQWVGAVRSALANRRSPHA